MQFFFIFDFLFLLPNQQFHCTDGTVVNCKLFYLSSYNARLCKTY